MRFLSILLATFAMAPVSAVAGQVYLIGFAKSGDSTGYNTMTSFTVPMASLDQCRASGEKLIENNNNTGKIQWNLGSFRLGYDCIEGR